MRIVVADCTVQYEGRLSAYLPPATRLIMLKADGSVTVHADGGAYKPLTRLRRSTYHLLSDRNAHFAECSGSAAVSGGQCNAWASTSDGVTQSRVSNASASCAYPSQAGRAAFQLGGRCLTMELWVRRIEDLRAEAESRGIDLSDIHIWEPVGWIVAAADTLGIGPVFALAFDLDWDLVSDQT